MRILLISFAVCCLAAAAWLILTLSTPPGVATPLTPQTEIPVQQPPAALPRTQTERREPSPSRVPTTNAATASVRGQLTRHDGQPLAGITLELRPGRNSPAIAAQATTNPDGRFEFLRAKPGTARLTASDPRVPSGFRIGPLDLRANQTVDLGTTRIAPTARLRGRVVDTGGRPMPGVTVYHALRRGFMNTLEFSRWHDAGGTYPTDPSVTTDAKGRFELDRVAPGDVLLLVEVPGKLDTIRELTAAAGGLTDVGDLVVRDGTAVRGTVRDRKGRGLAGVTITEVHHSTALERKSVTSRADGSFELRGVSESCTQLDFTKRGLIPLERPFQVEAASQAVHVILRPMLTLRGRVVGHGNVRTIVKLEHRVEDNAEATNSCVTQQSWRDHPVDAAGNFTIPKLTPGVFTLRAIAKGYGKSPRTKLRLDYDVEARDQPAITLEVTRTPPILVEAKDPAGHRLPNAVLYSDTYTSRHTDWKRAPMGTARTMLRYKHLLRRHAPDASGTIPFVFDRESAVILAIECPGYIPTSTYFPRGKLPVKLSYTLQPAAAIRGSVLDLPKPRPYEIRVVAWQEPRQQESQGIVVPIAADGSFHLAALPPGTWHLGLRRADITRRDDQARRAFGTMVPVIADGIDPRTRTTVSTTAGEVARVTLRLPPSGWLRGRVLSRGQPVAGAEVCVVPRGEIVKGHGGLESYRNWDSQDAHRYYAHTHTDRDGRYEFVFQSPGAFDIYARAKGSASHTPARFEIRRPGEQIQRNINLPGAAIRGQVARAVIGNRPARKVRACLFRLAAAKHDPNFAGDWMTPQSFNVVRRTLAANGAFAFEHLPKERWCLRIIHAGQTLLQRVVETHGDADVDLGEVSLPLRHNLELSVRLPPLPRTAGSPVQPAGWGAWITSIAPGRPAIHVATTFLAPTTRLSLPSGRYRVSLMKVLPFFATSLSGKPTGQSGELIVHANGRTTPKALDFTQEK